MELCLCGACNTRKPIEDTLFLDCSHTSCKNCTIRDVSTKISINKVSEIKCFDCNTALPFHSLREILDEKTFEKLTEASVLEFLDSQRSNYAHCPNPNCKNVMELIQDGGATRSPRGARITCNTCGTVFCASCMMTPYHSDYTCEQYQIFLTTQDCRFCHAPIVHKKVDSFTSVCSAQECQSKRNMACNKILRCGHYCCGINREMSCLSCLHLKCAPTKAASYCGICWVDKLDAAPCIQLACGHIFHLECVRKQIRSLWNGARITFRFTECALCKEKIQHPILDQELRFANELYEQVKVKAVRRLKLICKEEVKNEEEVAMKKFSYFLCDQCKHPYFGGENVCEDNALANPKDLICGTCSAQKCGGICARHGIEYLEFKCKYCCSISSYFCWGTTHFCASCHSKAAEVAVLPREKLPPCTCNISHPPNGEEFCFGCLACKLEM